MLQKKTWLSLRTRKDKRYEKYEITFLDNVVSSPEHNRVLAEYRNYNEDMVSDSFFYAYIDVTLEYHDDISYDKITHLEIGERNINDADFMFLIRLDSLKGKYFEKLTSCSIDSLYKIL